MSYYFTILSPTDAPLFSQEFGTSKTGGDGASRFRFPDNAQYMNQFIVHASLDIVEEVQWTNGAMYLKHVDTYPPASAYVSAFLTGTGVRFILLHQPLLPSSSNALSGGGRASSSSIANNPTSPQTEEAIRQFMNEIYENWVKTVMSPFCGRGMEITSPVFRNKVLAAGKKWL
ncbi:TRAPP subunit [Ophidiomyces ophidiicola]|nr:TRAPP subunit [Ophidiomyces ophidiicola]KAI1983017.1 TRAPP subunit [Ophidiomyces ophidiicola]KAI1984159.1 TRAPP subunit [Ophidiomyces ophidiicola]KAI1997949.1 TRAPP subunit [Ophidiomyces ophidiicola]